MKLKAAFYNGMEKRGTGLYLMNHNDKMRAYRKIWLLGAVVACFLALTANAWANAPEDKGSLIQRLLGYRNKGDVQLMAYLMKMGDKLDCYFTFETASVPASTRSMLFRYIAPGTEPNSIEELVANLEKAIEGSTVSRDPQAPRILHVRTRKVHNVLNNPLDQRGNFGINGSLSDVLKESYRVSKGQVRSAISHAIPIEDPGDHSTKVHFVSSELPIRKALTDYVPLSGYNRVLWIAGFEEFEPRTIAAIWLNGRDWRWSPAGEDKPVPFSEGRMAYYKNLPTEANITAALQFIEEQMKQPEPLQVRWAMLWLGRHKIEKSIPTLLAHLDYEYMPVPLLDERFPAFRALKELGSPAAGAASGLLTQEKDATRLELLARIVLSVWGEVEGRKALQNAVAASKDKAQQQRMEATFKAAAEFTPAATVETR